MKEDNAAENEEKKNIKKGRTEVVQILLELKSFHSIP